MRRALVLAALALASIARAQTAPPTEPTFHPGQTYTIHHNVSLVVLDGVALDQKNHVVTDLTADDFYINEDDHPQNIRNFEAAGKYTPAANLNINSTAQLDQLAPHAPVNIVLLDEVSTRFEDMAYARWSLKKWLDAQPAHLDTPTMLIAVSLEKFQVLRDYTQDPTEILDALNQHFVEFPWHLNQAGWNDDSYMAAHLALRRVAEATSSHRGPKTMIWLGRGLPSLRHSHHSTDLEASADTTTSHTLDELRDARVTLYTIDPSGVLVDREDAYPTPRGNYWPFGGDPRFEAMALVTGGRNFANRNDVDAAIGSSIRDGSSVYTLTYIPSDPDKDPKKLRHIQVVVKRPGVRFITRSAYFPDSHIAHMHSDGSTTRRLDASMLSAAESNMQYAGVRFTAAVSTSDPSSVHIHVDNHGIGYYIPKDEAKPRHTRLIMLATTLDPAGKETGRQGESYNFILPDASRSGPFNIPLDWDFKLDSAAKATHLRIVLRVESSGHMGTVDLPLTAGATADSAPPNQATTTTRPQPHNPPPPTEN
jgi:VWFA-related protein